MECSDSASTEKATNKKPKDPKESKCFYYGKIGQFKKACREFLSTKGKEGKETFYLKVCLVEESKDTWVINSGATNHVCVSSQGFVETRSLHDMSFSLQTGDDSLVVAETV